MTVSEIFAKLNSHMIEGIMLHDQFASYYDFLNLVGYKRCHKYHALHEMKARRKTLEYYTSHFGKPVEDIKATDPKVIPANWYAHTRRDADAGTKRKAVKEGFMKWNEWEKNTKDLYQRAYKELMETGEIAAALFIGKLIKDVDCELKEVEKHALKLSDVDYDIVYIYECQPVIHKKYKHLMSNKE